MKNIKEIRGLALKKYPDFVKQYFSEQIYFPFRLDRLGKYKSSDAQKKFSEIQMRVEELQLYSKDTLGFGYTIVYEEIHSRQMGENKFPIAIEFPTEKDYLQFIEKEKEFSILKSDIAETIESIPKLRELVLSNPLLLVSISENLEKILSICQFFLNNPRPNLYLRELPIPGLDTKFIETHEKELKLFLDYILPKESINSIEKKIEKRYFLKTKPNLIRFRILDANCRLGFPESLSDISLPLDEFQSLKLDISNVFITENLVNFLSFPKVIDSIILVGKGYEILSWKSLDNLKEKNIYYWGDIDSHGFKILSEFRKYFPQTKSLLMEETVYENFSHLSNDENSSIPFELEGLTETELSLFRFINENSRQNRLEQEKIPLDYVLAYLEKLSFFCFYAVLYFCWL